MAVTNSLVYLTNGTLADADDVLSNNSFILNNMLSYAIDGATTTNQNNLINFTTANLDSSNSTAIQVTTTEFYAGDLYDDYSNATFDTTTWTASPVGQGAWVQNTSVGVTSIVGNDRFVTSTGSGTSLDLAGQNSEVVVRFVASTGGGTGITFQLGDGTGAGANVVTIESVGASSSGDSVYRIVYNFAADTFDAWKDDSLIINGTSLAAFGANIYLRLTSNTGGNGSGQLYLIAYALNGGAGGTKDVMFSNTSPIAGDVFLAKSIPYPSGTTLSSSNYSTDNGVGYTAFTEEIITDESSFTQLKFKYTLTIPTTITADTENIPRIDKMGCYYG